MTDLQRICLHCCNEFVAPSKYSNQKYCSYICRFKQLMPDRFTDKCLRWPKSCNPVTGYGQMNIALAPPAKMVAAHRLSYEIYNGPLEPGSVVLHTCDHRWCVNPNHLIQGTQKDNIGDMWSKGREAKRKLSKREALEIKASKERSAVLAERYGLHEATIRKIRSGRMWRSLTV
jgi:hypothetical protein